MGGAAFKTSLHIDSTALHTSPAWIKSASNFEPTAHAGMLVLCRRAGLTADECTADCLVLTLLWCGQQWLA